MVHPAIFNNRKPKKVIGLRSATEDEIANLIADHPSGYHRTHMNDGSKLPFNGVFVIF